MTPRSRQSMHVFLAALLVIGPSGCFNMVKQVRVQQIEVKTDPPGASIAVKDEEMIVRRGTAPIVVEQRYVASVKRFRRWHWIWPVLFAGATGGSVYLWAKGDRNLSSGGGILTVISVLGLALATTTVVIFERESGKVASTEPSSLHLVITPPGGGKPQDHFVALATTGPAAFGRWSSVVRLEPDTSASTRPASAPARMLPPLPRGTVIAVFDINDQTGAIPESTLSQLTGRLSAKLTALDLNVVPHDRISFWLGSGGSRLRCFPGTCHSEVGRAVAAQKTLWTRLVRLGEVCTLSANLYAVGSSVVERTAAVRSDCTADSLGASVDKLAARIGAPGDLRAP